MRPQKTKEAFTLLEMTIAITITAITGLSVAGATIALSQAHQDTANFYQSLQTARSAMIRIQKAVNKAELITACTSTVIILWADDTNNDGKINVDELLVLALDAESRQITLYRLVFPTGLAAALNVEAALADLTDASTVTKMLTDSEYDTSTVLATDVTDFCLTASPAPPMTVMVGIRLTVGVGTTQITLRSAAAPRAAKTARVSLVEGKLTLVPK